MQSQIALDSEWLEADGLGGFASGTVGGARSRRYHSLLLAATTPPTGRMVLVNGLEVWAQVDGVAYPLSNQHYLPDVHHPRGDQFLESFSASRWPKWTFCLPGGLRIEQELFVPHERAAVALRWRVVDNPSGASEIRLTARPLLSGRDYHALHHENSSFQFDANVIGQVVGWQPYPGVPGVNVLSNATYRHAPEWYRSFLYRQEAERGLDASEDLASPGEFTWDLAKNDAVWIATASGMRASLGFDYTDAAALFANLQEQESARRSHFRDNLERAADQYIVRRENGRTIVAGYPWFTDWGRDTFIAMRGLVIATGRVDIALEILAAWSRVVSQGMLPNRFADSGETPEFNSVDASLWFVVAAHETLSLLNSLKEPLPTTDHKNILAAMSAILNGYIQGTRYNIHVDNDGLLAAGEPGVQLTWMDAKVGDWVVTPRIGKPVELQALWLNALWIAQQWISTDGPWESLFAVGKRSFQEKFWNAETSCLYDVVDVDHQIGAVDASIRPNQILAIGGLPLQLFAGAQAESIVAVVQEHLLTPLGLRSLSPHDAAYRARYEGDVWSRDGAYHQGTIWPWLIGPFVEAWLRVHGNTATNRAQAREAFLGPLLEHLQTAGLEHISEIADATAPRTPRGCPFQAWSLGEVLRLDRIVLAEPKSVLRTSNRRLANASKE